MRKLGISLLLFLSILVGCTVGGGKPVEEATGTLLNATRLTVTETLNVKDTSTEYYDMYRVVTIAEMDSGVLAHSSITDRDDTEVSAEMFVDDTTNIMLRSGEAKKRTIDKQTSLAGYFGIAKLLDGISTHSTKGDELEGVLLDSDIIPLVKNFLLYTNSNITTGNIIVFNTHQYTVYFDEDLTEVKSIHIDFTKLAQNISSEITDASYTLEFAYTVDREIPVYDDPDIDPDNAAVNLALRYLDKTFDNIKTLKTDMILNTSFISNPRDIAFAYRSSNTSVLSNTGKYNAPLESTEITLVIDVLYKGEKAATKTIVMNAPKPIERQGEWTSQANPLFRYAELAENLDIYFIDMIQQYGDSIYIKSGDFDMLIDAGNVNDGATVKKLLTDNVTDQVLELLVVTHAHSDHLGGLATALTAVRKVDMILDYGYQRTDYQTAVSYQNQTRNSVAKYCAVTDANSNSNGCLKKMYLTPEITIDILNTGQYRTPSSSINSSNGNNEASVTFMLTYRNTSFYFSGDLDSSGESKVINNENLSKYNVNVMKATHHGTNDGNSTAILNALKPDYVAISAAIGTIHPVQGALNRIKSSGAKMYCTFTNGTYKFTSNGQTVGNPVGSPPAKPYQGITGEENLEFTQTTWYKRNRN